MMWQILMFSQENKGNTMVKVKCFGCLGDYLKQEGHYVSVSGRKVFWCGRDECCDVILNKKTIDEESEKIKYNTEV